jgi:hypothetical protein
MTDTATEAPAPASHASLWEDFLDIFYAPREVYARRRDAGFGLVLLIVTVLMAALFFAAQGPLADAFAAEFRRGMAQAGAAGQQMTPEQMEGARRMGSIFGSLAVLVGVPLGVVLIGLALWGLGKLFGSVATAGMAILVVTYAQFPRVLQTVVLLLQGLLFNPPSLAGTSLGPARFFDPDTTSAVLMATLMRLDVFYLWSTVLIAIGAQVLGRVPKAQSYLLAALVWAIGGIVPLVGALARG